MKTWKKELTAALAFLLALFVFCAATSECLIPFRGSYGSTWKMYENEDRDSIQALFFGSSLAYCDIVPAVIYEKTGISSYVMAGPEQTPAMTYYYVREALKTQKNVQAVFVEVTGVFYGRYENYSKVNIGYMPWGLNRLEATFKAADPQERTGLLFPLYNYHDRWSSIGSIINDIRLSGNTDTMAGYTLMAESTAQDSVIPREPERDDELRAENFEYLRMIADYCEEKGVRTVFFISPVYYRLNDSSMEMLKNNLPDNALFRDFNDSFDSIGLDGQSDYYDNLHCNWRGAQKLSTEIGDWMTELCITPGECNSALWQSRVEEFKKATSEL